MGTAPKAGLGEGEAPSWVGRGDCWEFCGYVVLHPHSTWALHLESPVLCAQPGHHNGLVPLALSFELLSYGQGMAGWGAECEHGQL